MVKGTALHYAQPFHDFDRLFFDFRPHLKMLGWLPVLFHDSDKIRIVFTSN